MTYCRQCRLGTLDADGLCLLCGAPQTPPTKLQRAAEAGGVALSALFHPLVGVALCLALLAAAVRAIAVSPLRFGNPPVFALFQGPARAAGGDVLGALQGLAGIALAQVIILLLIVLALWLFVRRRQSGGAPDSLAAQH